MPDSAPDYAVAALERAIEARGTTPAGGEQALADGAISLPSLTFRFKAPSFLGDTARWVLFVALLVLALGALLVAWSMVATTRPGGGAEWVWPPIMTLVVAAIAIGFAYAAVMGFGDVDVSTSIGSGGGGDAGKAALTVSSTVPGDGATDIAPDVQLEAVFSEAVDPATLTGATYLLHRVPDGVAVAGSVAAEGETVGRFTPAAALSAGTAYRAEITTGVKAVSGAALAEKKTWSFTTQA
jgi:hypothetical protein